MKSGLNGAAPSEEAACSDALQTKPPRAPRRRWACPSCLLFCLNTGNARASLVAQMVENLPVVQETQVRSLAQKDPWRRERQSAPVFLPGESHAQSSLAGHSGLQSTGSKRVGHDWVAFTFHSWCDYNEQPAGSPIQGPASRAASGGRRIHPDFLGGPCGSTCPLSSSSPHPLLCFFLQKCKPAGKLQG